MTQSSKSAQDPALTVAAQVIERSERSRPDQHFRTAFAVVGNLIAAGYLSVNFESSTWAVTFQDIVETTADTLATQL